ncbi:MAG: hypothetical protein NC342_01495 [Pseudoflavonifractor sp.]|nr:hypothetical protein [Alloprevotella sp.]MCM1116199.1 hypothetical protein [Pseudoflavonifractor sp.]
MDNYPYLSISNSPDTGALDLFMPGTDEVYTIMPVSRGWRFSRVTRRGTVSVSVADGRILSGARILDALRIAAACPGGGNELFSALAAADIPAAPLRAPEWMLPTPVQLSGAAGTAIRSFLAGRDIQRMLSFPFQDSSAPFAAVILAPATAALRQAMEDDPSVVRLSTPITRRYAVIYPDGVRPSAKEVAYGDPLSLTYYAEGMQEAVHSLTAGKPSPFVEYDGAAINVRPISALGIKLEPLKTAEPQALPNSPAASAIASVKAPQTGERTVGMKLRFAPDRVIRADVSLNEDSPEYRLLRAGMFHGYRARRLAVKNHNEENYLIDLRQPAADTPAEAPVEDAPTPQATEDKPRRGRRSTGPWLYMLLIIAAIALGIVAVSYLPGLFSHVDSYRAEPPAEVAISDPSGPSGLPDLSGLPDSSAETVDTPEALPAASTADDLAYLNRAEIWHRDSLATPAALAIFDSFASGNLAEIPAQEFFASGQCSNPLVKKTIKLIWQAYRSDTQTSNERALRSLAGSASIDFNELFNSLAGIQSAHPNTRPLPGS